MVNLCASVLWKFLHSATASALLGRQEDVASQEWMLDEFAFLMKSLNCEQVLSRLVSERVLLEEVILLHECAVE